MSISFEGDSLEKAQVTVSYVAMPVIDETRIKQAKACDCRETTRPAHTLCEPMLT
jgi:hypothetical protein